MKNSLKKFAFLSCLICGVSSCFGQASGELLRLELEPANTESNQWTLSWNTETSFVYYVEESEDLSNWSFVRYYLAEEAARVEETFAIDKSRLFFRLRLTEFTSDNTSPLLTGDFDGDSISNYDEINFASILGLDALDADSDDNGINDGDEDSDFDGDINAYEFTNGRLVLTPDADVNLYTDTALGDDSNTGISAVPNRPATGDGPKATITSAITAAVDSDIILMQPGTYSETIWVLTGTGKDLTLRPNGTVTIR